MNERTPEDKAQTNCTDPELRIMQTPNKGWEYCGNAQASVDAACQIIVACDVTEASNDKQQAQPMARLTLVERLKHAGIAWSTRERLGHGAEEILATHDSGYYSEAAAANSSTVPGWELRAWPRAANGIMPRSPKPETAPPLTAKDRMAAKVRTPEGRALYSQAQSDRGTGVWPDRKKRGVSAGAAAWFGQNP